MAIDTSLTDVLISNTSSSVGTRNNISHITNTDLPNNPHNHHHHSNKRKIRTITGLTWRSLHSVSDNPCTDPLGYYFPTKLALCLSVLKLIIAVGMVALGLASLTLRAPLSSLGVGLWAGAVVGVSGFLGVCASRRPHVRVYVVGFLCVCTCGVASSGLAVVLAATAWARDSHAHAHAVYIDQETQEEVTGLGEVLISRPSALVSSALVVVAVVDCMLSLACVAVSAREACGLYQGQEKKAQGMATEGHNRKERLYRWLGQQKTIFPLGSPHAPPGGISSISQFLPLASSDASSSATPRKNPSSLPFSPTTSSIPSSASHHHSIQPSHFSSSTKPSVQSIPAVLKPSALPLQHQHGMSHSLPPPSITTLSYPSHPDHIHHNRSKIDRRHSLHPHMHHPPPLPFPQQVPGKHPSYPHHPATHFPPYSVHPSLYYPHILTPMMPHYPSMGQEHQQPNTKKNKRHHRTPEEEEAKRRSKKHKRKQKRKEEQRKNKKKKELTDEQIERTYTGLDRELAEEFIDSAMEPALSIQRAFHGSFSQESF